MLHTRTAPPGVRSAVALATACHLVLLGAGVASAHVAVTSPDATPGAELGLFTFRVPTESDTARTVKVTIGIPKTSPFADVQVRPLTGWAVTTGQTPLGQPTKVGDFTLTKYTVSATWTAGDGQGIQPGPAAAAARPRRSGWGHRTRRPPVPAWA